MKVVVIEDHRDSADSLCALLEAHGHRVRVVYDSAEGLAVVASDPPDLVLVDLMLPGANGLELLRQFRADRPDLPVIVTTGHVAVSQVVEVMQAGAFTILEKPLEPSHVLDAIQKVDARAGASRDAPGASRGPEPQTWRLGEMITRSERVRHVMDLVMAVAPTDASVLLWGENGTGKELIADAIHRHSPRAGGPFIKVNCAAIPGELIESELFGYRRGAFTGAVSDRTGLFEAANGGTLLLDEIGEMPPHLQAKLLRVLQDRLARPIGSQRDVELDFRLICATNCALHDAIKNGSFREDLYFRVNTITVKVPALRERPEDIVLLADHFRERFAREYDRPVGSIHPQALHLLTHHAWRGNVRELEHAIERAVIVAKGNQILPDDLPDGVRTHQVETDVQFTVTAPRLQTLADIEKWAIERTLEHTRGNKRAAAAILGVYRPTLYNKLRKYGIDVPGAPPRRDSPPGAKD